MDFDKIAIGAIVVLMAALVVISAYQGEPTVVIPDYPVCEECESCEVCETCEEPEECPVIPEEPEFEPVMKTALEVQAFAIEQLFECVYEGDDPDIEYRYQTTNDYPLPVDEFGYYGYPATTLRPEVTGARVPEGGRQVWRVIVDPNNGWIQELICDYTRYPDECPKDESGEYIWIRNSPFDNPDSETYQALDTGDNSMIIAYIAFSECDSITEWRET